MALRTKRNGAKKRAAVGDMFGEDTDVEGEGGDIKDDDESEEVEKVDTTKVVEEFESAQAPQWFVLDRKATIPFQNSLVSSISKLNKRAKEQGRRQEELEEMAGSRQKKKPAHRGFILDEAGTLLYSLYY